MLNYIKFDSLFIQIFYEFRKKIKGKIEIVTKMYNIDIDRQTLIFLFSSSEVKSKIDKDKERLNERVGYVTSFIV